MRNYRLVVLGALILLLNVIWEFSHFRLYIDLTGIPKTQHLLIASFTDLILISLIFALNSFNQKSIKWIEKPKWIDYLFIIIIGTAIAAAIEIYSVGNGRWAYTELMPTIFGIGVSPLVQLFVTGILGLLIFNFLYKKLISFY